MKQTGPVALRHFAEVSQHGSEGGTTQRLVTCHGPQEGSQVALDVRALELLGIGQDLSRAFDPAIGCTNQGPELSSLG